MYDISTCLPERRSSSVSEDRISEYRSVRARQMDAIASDSSASLQPERIMPRRS